MSVVNAAIGESAHSTRTPPQHNVETLDALAAHDAAPDRMQW
jgi:hypothetical protein